MHSLIDSVIRYLTNKPAKKTLVSLYEQTKFKLPFYLHELELYQFILEHPMNTPAERDYFMSRHTATRYRCLKAIQELENLICLLNLSDNYEAHIYMEQYKRFSKIVKSQSDYPYFTLNYN